MTQTVYLNGKFLPLEEAAIPVLDRGFIFGDGVYEMIPVYSRRAFRLPEHIHRLQQSLSALRLDSPHTAEQWQALLLKLIEHNEGDDLSLYLQVTRGPAPRDHAFPKVVSPTVFMMSNPLVVPSALQVSAGVAAISTRDIRWDRCDIKTTSLLANVLLRQQAEDVGAAEAVMFRDGILTEGTSSNVFAVERGVILAPPKDRHMLPGITYDVVLELAAADGIAVEISYFDEARIRAADELWLSSSTKEVLAVVTLDGQAIGNGKPGPMFHRMYGLYQDYKKQVMRHG